MESRSWLCVLSSMLWLLVGCPLLTEQDLAERMDLDGDGIPRPVDCDDLDSTKGAAQLWFVDVDGDGFGSEATVERCEQEDGAEQGGDCDDDDPAVFPGAAELCNGVDDDCDDLIDDGVEIPIWYLDADGDQYGVSTESREQCDQPVGFADNADDCDDGDPLVHPENPWYADEDADGYGDPEVELLTCDPPSGYVVNDLDCNDEREDVNPAGVEVCDDEDEDEDCDLLIDDLDPSVSEDSFTTWYVDADADGFGDYASIELGCETPEGFVGNADDCDDAVYHDVGEGCGVLEIALSASDDGCVRLSNGVVSCFGDLASPEDLFIDIDGGNYLICGVRNEGTGICWDQNGFVTSWLKESGMTGVAVSTNGYSMEPTGVGWTRSDGTFGCVEHASSGGWCSDDWNRDGDFWESVKGGHGSACAQRDDGVVHCRYSGAGGGSSSVTWAVGRYSAGNQGACGIPVGSDEMSCFGRDELEAIEGSFVDVSIWHNQSGCAVTTAGELECFGSHAPTPPDGDDFILVDVVSEHGCAVHADNTVECF